MANPLANAYALFKELIPYNINLGVPNLPPAVLEGLTENDRRTITNLFQLCMQSKSEPWASTAPKIIEFREICFTHKLHHYHQLITCISLSAIHAQKCDDKQSHELAMGIIFDCVAAEPPIPLDVLLGFNEPMRMKMVTFVMETLVTFPEPIFLDSPQAGIGTIFEMWRHYLPVGATDPFGLVLQVLIRLPQRFWTQLSETERLTVTHLLNHYQTQFGLSGFPRNLSIKLPNAQGHDWSPAMSYVRELGMIYCLGRTLNVWQVGIGSIFSGYFQYFYQFALPYAACTNLTHTHARFVQYLQMGLAGVSSPRQSRLLKALDVFFGLADNRAQKPDAEVPINLWLQFLGHWETYAAEFHSTEPLKPIALKAIQILKHHGYTAAIGLPELLHSFCESNPAIEHLEFFFVELAPAIAQALQSRSLELQETIATQLLRLFQGRPIHPVTLQLLKFISPTVTSYPLVLCLRIRLLENAGPQSTATLIAEAHTLLGQLRFEQSLGVTSHAAHINALEQLLSASEKSDRSKRGKKADTRSTS